MPSTIPHPPPSINPIRFLQLAHIEIVYNRNLRQPKKGRLSLRQLARKLGLPKSTLHDEIRRGKVPRPNTFKGKGIGDYSSEIAQQAIDADHLNKGRSMKMNTTMAKLLRVEIVENRRSPYDALAHLRKQGFADLPSERSGYLHVHHGDLGISPSQLPYKPSTPRWKHAKPRRSLKMPGNLSIEEQPDLAGRNEFGHEEMDTVVSGVHGKGGLLVLIERQTRRYIVEKLPSLSREEVLRALRRILRSGRMTRVLSLTTDNGASSARFPPCPSPQQGLVQQKIAKPDVQHPPLVLPRPPDVVADDYLAE